MNRLIGWRQQATHGAVIRYKWLGYPGAKAIDSALEKLIKEI